MFFPLRFQLPDVVLTLCGCAISLMIMGACGDIDLHPIVNTDPEFSDGTPPLDGMGGHFPGDTNELPDDHLLVPATNILVGNIEINQGLAHVLYMSEGALPSPQPSIVAGRPGLLRVYALPNADFMNRELRARLTLEHGSSQRTIDDVKFVDGPPFDERIDGTFRFFLGLDDIKDGTKLSVALYERDASASNTLNTNDATAPSVQLTIPAAPGIADLQVTLVPVHTFEGASSSLPSNQEVIEGTIWDQFPLSALTVTTAQAVRTSGVRDDWLRVGCATREEGDESIFIIVGDRDGLTGSISAAIFDDAKGCVAFPLSTDLPWDSSELAQVTTALRRLLQSPSVCETVVPQGYSLTHGALLTENAFKDASCPTDASWVSTTNWETLLASTLP